MSANTQNALKVIETTTDLTPIVSLTLSQETPFEFNGHKLTTMLDQDGELRFIGKEVTDILEYSAKNSSNVIKRLCSESQLVKKGIIDSAFQVFAGRSLKISNQGMVLITESDLYSLVNKSEAACAKPFQDWVNRVVLPSIRKNGGYIQGQENMSEDDQKALAPVIRELKLMVSERDDTIVVLKKENFKLTKRVNTLENVISSMDKKLDNLAADNKAHAKNMELMIGELITQKHKQVNTAINSRPISKVFSDYLMDTEYNFGEMDYRNLGYIFHTVLLHRFKAVRRSGKGWELLGNKQLLQCAVQINSNTQNPRILYTDDVTTKCAQIINSVVSWYVANNNDRDKVVSKVIRRFNPEMK